MSDSHIFTDGQIFWGNRAAGVLPICTETKRILVNHRSRYVLEPDIYGVYGGKIDDEDLTDIEAVRRELEEEAGYDGEITFILAYIFRKGSFQYSNFIGLIESEFEPILDWESQGFLWLTYKELLDLPNKHYGLIALIENSGELIRKYTL